MSSPGEGLPSLLLLRLGGGGMEPNPKGGAGGIEPGRPCSLGGKGILAIEGGGGGIPKVVPVSLSSVILAHLASIRGSLNEMRFLSYFKFSIYLFKFSSMKFGKVQIVDDQGARFQVFGSLFPLKLGFGLLLLETSPVGFRRLCSSLLQQRSERVAISITSLDFGLNFSNLAKN